MLIELVIILDWYLLSKLQPILVAICVVYTKMGMIFCLLCYIRLWLEFSKQFPQWLAKFCLGNDASIVANASVVVSIKEKNVIVIS